MPQTVPCFATPLDIRLHKNGRLAKTLRPFSYITEINPEWFGYAPTVQRISPTIQAFAICVPEGFVTDFASIPRIFWPFIDKLGPQAWPAVVHDYLYTTHPEGRPWADTVFFEALKANSAGLLTRATCFAMVRAFGRWSWDGTPQVWPGDV
jgi:hypothetical protein